MSLEKEEKGRNQEVLGSEEIVNGIEPIDYIPSPAWREILQRHVDRAANVIEWFIAKVPALKPWREEIRKLALRKRAFLQNNFISFIDPNEPVCQSLEGSLFKQLKEVHGVSMVFHTFHVVFTACEIVVERHDAFYNDNGVAAFFKQETQGKIKKADLSHAYDALLHALKTVGDVEGQAIVNGVLPWTAATQAKVKARLLEEEQYSLTVSESNAIKKKEMEEKAKELQAA